MTLRSRLTFGLLTIAVILIVPLLVATRSLDKLHGQAKQLRNEDFAASLVLGRMRDALNDLRQSEIALLFVRDTKSRDAMTNRLQVVQNLADSLDAYGLGQAARDVRGSMNAVAGYMRTEYASAVAGRAHEAERISTNSVVPAITTADAAVSAAERALRDRTRERVASAATSAKQGGQIAIIGLALALIVAAVIAVRLTHSVSHPVHEIERGMRRVADGDFDTKLDISPDRQDEFGRLAASFEEMSRQLAELDKLKAEFVSIASHELKTPINVIIGYTQLLQEELYGPLTAKQRNVADVLDKQAKSLARLVKQLLDVTRFEAGAGKLDVRPVELRTLLHNLEQGFQVLADQRGVRFKVSTLEDSLPTTVYWDHDRINEVLGNLISNALKFTDRGGEVEVTTMALDHSIQINVRDTGAGIPPEQLPRIFEKFFQADNQDAARPGTQTGGGSGLGLAISREIVEAHHGTLTCDSTPGVGTTFSVVLPERATSTRRSSAPHPAAVAEVA
jgi:signal transduction histidine kinase